MKKRMAELLNGKIAYEPSQIVFSQERIEASVAEGGHYRQRFLVQVADGKNTQGFFCSTNPRVTVRPAGFEGAKAEFVCEMNSAGLRAGDTVEGTLVLNSMEGEYCLPYSLTVESNRREAQTRELPGLTPEEFAALAKEDFGKAYVLFVGRDFAELTQRWGGFYHALYEGICAQTVTYHSLEQFLVGAGLKAPVRLTAETEHVYLRELEESVKEELILTKNTWGFAHLTVKSDADFLSVERAQATTEEFVGSMYSVGYFIDVEKLHAGRNLARLTVSWGSGSLECAVEVMGARDHERALQGQRQKQAVVQLWSSYLDYRTEKCRKDEWLMGSLKLMQSYRDAGGSHIFGDLYEIYLLFESGKTVDAQLLLSEITKRKEELTAAEYQGLYLYLTTMENQEREYLEYVKEEIGGLFLKEPENWMLQWLSFRLSPQLLRNDTEKLDCIRRQYLGGCKSPLMYVEAYELLKKEPLLLRSLGAFEVHLLKFICREHLLDREICGQAAQLALRLERFDALLYRVLCRCYEVYPTKNMLTAICTMLIQGHKSESIYGKWYALGIREDVRVTGLYEYYAATMQGMDEEILPQSVRMYFAYHNTLDYARKAAIYANVLRNRSRDAKTYGEYRFEMERFVEEQLAAGRVNRDLALLYEALLTKEMLQEGREEQLAQGLSRVMFTCEIRSTDPQMRHVVVVHDQFSQEERVQLAGGRACVHIYSPHCGILLEDAAGRRYADASLYEKEQFLTRPLFEDYCREKLKNSAGFLLHDCCSADGEVVIDEKNAGRFVRLLGLPGLKESYRRTLRVRLIEFYYGHPNTEYLEEFLRMTDDDHLAATHRRELTELLSQEGMSDRAYALLRACGSEGVRPGVLVQIASRQIEAAQYREDAELLALCETCLRQNTYNGTVLEYLIRYYEGRLADMKRLWQAAQGFELDAFALEERILALILYLRQGMEGTEDIFASYRAAQGKTRLCRAYAALMAYEYFVREKNVQEPVFSCLAEFVADAGNAPEVCRLALLRYYCTKDRCTPGEQKWLLYLLERAVKRGQIFAFYRRLSDKVLRRYDLHDRFILECRANPAHHVTLHYRLNGKKECSVPMENRFEGIFTKDFILFYQDRLTWYYTIESEDEVRTTPEQSFMNERRSARGTYGRYELINRLVEAQAKGDQQSWRELKEQYLGQQYLVEELFRLN